MNTTDEHTTSKGPREGSAPAAGSAAGRPVLLAGGALDGKLAEGVVMTEPDETLYHAGHFYSYTGRVAAFMTERPFVYTLTA